MTSTQSSIGDAAIPGWYDVDPTTTDLKPNPHPHYKHLREVQPHH